MNFFKISLSKKLIIVSLIIFIIIFSSPVLSTDDPDSLIFYNLGMQNIISGFAGIADIKNPVGFLLNPAISADIYKNNVDFSISGFNKYFVANALFQMPVDFGNLSFYLSYLYDSFSGGIENDVIFKANFSKLISENFWVGFSLNLMTSIFNGTTAFGIGTDIGFVSILNKSKFEGFGFSNIKWGVSLKNAGYPLIKSGTVLSPIGIAGGINFDFFNYKDIISISNSSDLYINFYPLGIGLLSSINTTIYDNYFLNIGINFGTENSTLNPSNYLFFSAGGNFYFEDNKLGVSYTITPSFSSTGVLKHSIDINYNFGERDTQPPSVDIKIDKLKFSPNFDGNSDEINLYLNFKDNGLLYGWKVTIYDKNGNIVKEYIGTDVRQIKYITLKKIFERLFAKKEQVKIPQFITWDGTDSKGNIVKDGVYNIKAVAWDERNNIGKSKDFKVFVDTGITDISYNLPGVYGNIFSPNDDGKKDKLNINIKFNDITDDDNIKVKIKDSNDNVINEFNYSKKDVDGNILYFKWDGSDKNGKKAKEGVYKIDIVVEDLAGNKKQIEIKDIKLVTHYEKIDCKSDTDIFSPNGDGKLDTIVFKNKVDDTDGLLSWEALIENEYGKTVKMYSGEKTIPDTISWDGKDDNGKEVVDGIYKYRIKLSYNNGNEPVSNEINFVKDTKPAEIIIKPEYFSFSPNNDGKKDNIKIEIVSNEIENIKMISIIDKKTNEKIAKLNFKKEGNKAIIIWDGKDENGNELPAGRYIIDVYTEDRAKNTKEFKSVPITLVRELEKVFVDSDILYYSPNNDGRYEQINFKFSADNKEGLLNTIFYITDESDKIVFKKEFKGLPDNFEFNEKLKDGKYYYYAIMNYDNGNSPVSFKKYFITDTIAAKASIKVVNQYFSPNNDGFKDNLNLNYSFNESVKKVYLQIIDSNDKSIKNIKLESTNNEYSLSGEDLNDGQYFLNLISYDNAGNKGEITHKFFVNRMTPDFDIDIDKKLISPNDDNYMDNLKISFLLDDSRIKNIDRFQKAIVEIYDQNGKKVFEKIFYSKPEYLYWYGKDVNHKPLSDGKYIIKSRIYYVSGINKYSNTFTFDVDNTPPEGTLVVKPELFSPDNDGDKDRLYISLNFSDYHKIDSYKVEIFRKYSENKLSKKPFKVFESKLKDQNKITRQIVWDGIGDNGKLVDSASDYTAIFTIKDIAGNENLVKKDFYVDILVIKTAMGYKIIISSIEFDFNSYKLKPQSKKILDRLITILNKFKKYKVQIIGYTDSIGEEDYNLELSKKRAKSVYRYLIEHDIDPNRLSFTGMGESNPIDTNDNEEGRRRNRRVEFYLIK